MDQFLGDLEGAKQSWWPYVVTFVITVIAAVRFYIAGTQCPSQNRIDGKNVVITGGSSGIGLATAKEIAKRGANIILAVRNAERGKDAMKAIKEVHPGANVIVKVLDLSDFTSIREFANQLTLEFEQIDVLINNAGIIFQPYRRAMDGNELTMTTNYFGPFLLTHLMLPLLTKSDDARVINLSAMAHNQGKIDLDDLNAERSPIEVFAQSKLALTIFSKQMASLLKHTNISFYAVNPGLVRGTGHLRNSRLETSLATKLSVWPWMFLFLKTPKQGSQTVLYATLEPALKNVSGCYLSNCEIQDPSELVKDTELADKLYKKTCEIVSIDGEKLIGKLSGKEGVLENEN